MEWTAILAVLRGANEISIGTNRHKSTSGICFAYL